MRSLVFLALTLVFTTLLPAQVKIIFDTDMDTDCDDAGALAILHVLADRSEVEILATVDCSRYPLSAPCVEAINRYYGREDLPIGTPKSPWPNGERCNSCYAKQVVKKFSPRLKSNAEAPNAVDVYRRALVGQDNGRVVIVSVGYLTNLRDLLESKPDAISPLSGRELVRQKVSRWVCVGSSYPQRLSPKVFGNFTPDPSSAMIAVRDWPGPIYFSSTGTDVLTGSRLHETPADNPVRQIYELYLRAKRTEARPS